MAGPTHARTVAPTRDKANLPGCSKFTRKILFQGNHEQPLHLHQARHA
ncbi:uncharacterized protein METZ01_LOCUS408257, partial [marine metagenome]